MGRKVEQVFSCDSEEGEVMSDMMSYVAMQDEMSRMQVKIDALKHNSCPVCCGKPISGKPCVCEGSGDAVMAYGGIANILAQTELENERLKQQLEATRKPLTDELTFWVVEQFEDGNGRSLGYWTGHNSRDFTPNILDAIQFCRKDDALIAKSSWHWKDCEVT